MPQSDHGLLVGYPNQVARCNTVTALFHPSLYMRRLPVRLCGDHEAGRLPARAAILL